MKKPFNELIKLTYRITGISIPVFGISWNPPTGEVEVAEKLITFLEDRRVLYTSPKYEIFNFAIDSVQEIRRRVSNDLECLSRDANLTGLLREMSAAAVNF